MYWLKKIAADYGYITDPSGRVFWGKQGSGCLFVRNHPQFDRQILLILRSPDVEEPDTWGISGGALSVGESDLFSSALRETLEEIGSVPPFRKIGQYVWKAPNGSFTYTTFILEVSDMSWTPNDFNWEVSDAVWVSYDQISSFDLHFGVQSLLEENPVFKEPEISNEIQRPDIREDEEDVF